MMSFSKVPLALLVPLLSWTLFDSAFAFDAASAAVSASALAAAAAAAAAAAPAAASAAAAAAPASGPAGAADPGIPLVPDASLDLPPEAQVMAALRALPEVRAAQQILRVEHANRARLLAGAAEWQLRSALTQRRVSGSGQLDQPGNFREWELAIERPWRSGNKAGIDARLGDAGVAHAENASGDAQHEAARSLLRRWFTLRRLDAELTVLRNQRRLWEQTGAAVAQRVKAGDAAQLDFDLAQAGLAQADARLADAIGRNASARADFDRAYPELSGVQVAGLCTPQADPLTLDDYIERLFADHHELGMAQAELDRRIQLAERARADQQPDPVFGVRVASERGGAEHLAGIVLTLPLGGENRAAATRAALAEVEAAREQVARVRRRLEGELASLYAARQGLLASWQANRASAERMGSVAKRIEHAYTLGELGLSEVLASRRQQQESELQESAARQDACEVAYRLRLDTHSLWSTENAGHS